MSVSAEASAVVVSAEDASDVAHVMFIAKMAIRTMVKTVTKARIVINLEDILMDVPASSAMVGPPAVAAAKGVGVVAIMYVSFLL